ncbi:hypothetical protein LNI90_05105 [Tenacibaculum dicentrarchi]|uniref:hypothetical protein n=1 Tax=Tenacibaculum dicentrarchi TaxID=669041 RepID=UPI000C7CAD22|nr:hypothetical protein [Tenacibaculum dicentrarchi]MCD8407641.1 hypothetical protein [Tenacibaculum dicentrarchi]MCD8414879.1 hypothetical protein [Tenacibaculum dicentrarchi]MCD8420003.1 hypothetical protein [Tenacibaculum dicentrarchi]MCD8425038.1 hypothetical protein [Tenacibaculum dicentrarchi]
MKEVLTKKRIIFLEILAVVCLSVYSSTILVSHLDKEINQFLTLAILFFIISLITITYKIRKEIIDFNSSSIEKTKIKFIDLFNLIAGLLLVVLILLNTFKISPKKHLDIIYVFMVLIFVIIIILNFFKRKK